MTVYETGSPYWLYVADAWFHLEGTRPGGDSLTPDRPTSTFVSLGGNRYIQRAAKAPRTWGCDWSIQSAEATRWLALAAQGFGGDVYLLDSSAAAVNMLDPRDVVGRVSGAPTISVESASLPTLATGYTFTRRLRAGVGYWFGGYTTGTAAATVMTYNIGAGAVNVAAPSGTGSRAFSATFTPASDVTATFVVASGGGNKVTALRLTEGSVDTVGFMPGENTPCRVSVSDPVRSLRFTWPNQPPLSDYTVTISEVG